MSTNKILRAIRSFREKYKRDPGFDSLERHSGISKSMVLAKFISLSDATQQAKASIKISGKIPKPLHLYAVELNPRVWTEKPGIRKKNPQFVGGVLPAGTVCLYVGYTRHPTPEDRVRKHLEGGQVSGRKIVTLYIRDRSRLVVEKHTTRGLVFRTKEDAEAQEGALARRLQKAGHAVYCDQLRQRRSKVARRLARSRRASR